MSRCTLVTEDLVDKACAIYEDTGRVATEARLDTMAFRMLYRELQIARSRHVADEMKSGSADDGRTLYMNLPFGSVSIVGQVAS